MARRGLRAPSGTGRGAGRLRPTIKLQAPDYVVLVVADLNRALDFYVDVLGLPLGHRSGAYAQLATGTTRLALYERDAMGETLGMVLGSPRSDAPGFELGFKVSNCDDVYEQLVAAGATVAVAPTDRPWGQRTAYIRDPDGHLVEIAQGLAHQAE